MTRIIKIVVRTAVVCAFLAVALCADGLMDAFGIGMFLIIAACLAASVGLVWLIEWIDVIADARRYGHAYRR